MATGAAGPTSVGFFSLEQAELRMRISSIGKSGSLSMRQPYLFLADFQASPADPDVGHEPFVLVDPLDHHPCLQAAECAHAFEPHERLDSVVEKVDDASPVVDRRDPLVDGRMEHDELPQIFSYHVVLLTFLIWCIGCGL